LVWLQEGANDTAAAVQASRPRADAAGEITAISEDGKVLTLESKTRSGEVAKTQIKLTDGTRIQLSGAEKPEDRKLRLGYQVTVWLQEGSQDTAALVLASARRRS